MARLPSEKAEDNDRVKSSLLRKQRLRAGEFRQKFHEAEKAKGESYSEFAYKLMANVQEWLKESKAFVEHDKVIQGIWVEQFYRRLLENARHWVQDRPDVNSADKAAERVDVFVHVVLLGRERAREIKANARHSETQESKPERKKNAEAKNQRRKKAFEEN